MKLTNTLTRQKEEFKPQNEKEVLVYTCGPTVYLDPHIGNWRGFIFYDTLVRTLKIAGYNVKHVLNITDVGHLTSDADEGEDKLQAAAAKQRKTAWDIARHYTDVFFSGVNDLNITMPTHTPKATDHIQEQIELIKTLEKKGYTYQTSDGVYFDTSKVNDYGKLAGKTQIDETLAESRIQTNQEKKHPADFALWKFSPQDKKRDMQWWAPWPQQDPSTDEKHPVGMPINLSSDAEQGEAVKGSWGFPGWHLECSALALKFLSETLDIHAGGIDHIPIHHTNEIAQSESATGKAFANYWLHNEFMMVEGKKMSKSLGNIYTLEDIKKRGYSALDFRLLVLQSHYRKEMNFTWQSLDEAKNFLSDLYRATDRQFQPIGDNAIEFAGYKKLVEKSLFDDLNTAGSIFDANHGLHSLADKVNSTAFNNTKDFKELLVFLDSAFGLNLADREDISEEQKQLIAQRGTLRAASQYGEADKIRDLLKSQDIELEDAPFGTVWYRVGN